LWLNSFLHNYIDLISLQDMEYSKKVIKYDSENILARTLNKNCYSNNPLFLRFMNETKLPFKPYEQFDKKALLERQSLYKEICKKIWDVNKIDLLANSY